MEPSKKKNLKLEMTCYDGKEITVKLITRKQAEKIDLKSYDFCYALCLDTVGYKDCEGEWQDILKQKHGLGPVTWPVLQAIQLNPGVGLDKKELIYLTNLKHLANKGILPRTVNSLRQVFGETKATQRMIVTPDAGPFTLMWPAKFTWIWITPAIL